MTPFKNFLLVSISSNYAPAHRLLVGRGWVGRRRRQVLDGLLELRDARRHRLALGRLCLDARLRLGGAGLGRGGVRLLFPARAFPLELRALRARRVAISLLFLFLNRVREALFLWLEIAILSFELRFFIQFHHFINL